jgi:hypothetical protein
VASCYSACHEAPERERRGGGRRRMRAGEREGGAERTKGRPRGGWRQETERAAVQSRRERGRVGDFLSYLYTGWYLTGRRRATQFFSCRAARRAGLAAHA